MSIEERYRLVRKDFKSVKVTPSSRYMDYLKWLLTECQLVR